MYTQIQRVLILISDFIMSALNESILQILKCPVCYELITKLAHCSNGHSVCSKCCDRLKHCPMCRANLDKCSKCPINQIIEKLEFPCTFRENGCDAVLSSKNKEIHESACYYVKIRCPMVTTWNKSHFMMTGSVCKLNWLGIGPPGEQERHSSECSDMICAYEGPFWNMTHHLQFAHGISIKELPYDGKFTWCVPHNPWIRVLKWRNFYIRFMIKTISEEELKRPLVPTNMPSAEQPIFKSDKYFVIFYAHSVGISPSKKIIYNASVYNAKEKVQSQLFIKEVGPPEAVSENAYVLDSKKKKSVFCLSYNELKNAKLITSDGLLKIVFHLLQVEEQA